MRVIDDEASEPDTMDPDPFPVVTLSADRTRASVGDVVTFTVKRNRPADLNDDTWQRISNTKHRVDIRIGGHMGVFRDHDDITEWEPIVRILHPGANRHPRGREGISYHCVARKELCKNARTQN